ncbi:MAG: DUF1893 domain-containing protein [Clostridia bacterium]
MDNIKELLLKYSCIVVKEDKTFTYSESGILPLLIQLDENGGLSNAYVADRVIGKAAALLMVYGGVREVYTRVISKYAKDVFVTHEIKYEADLEVSYIENRAGDGQCPMERLCLNLLNPDEAYKTLKQAVVR